jgi:heme-degrading monooxygenase HmoA
MPATILAQFKVADQATWRKVFEAKADIRKEAGCLGTHIFYNAKDPNEVIVNFQWDTEENASTWFDGDAAKAAMAEAGVSAPPLHWFLEDGGRTAS